MLTSFIMRTPDAKDNILTPPFVSGVYARSHFMPKHSYENRYNFEKKIKEKLLKSIRFE